MVENQVSTHKEAEETRRVYPLPRVRIRIALLATLAVRRAAGHLDVIVANLQPAPRRVIVVPGRRGTIGPARLLAPATDGSASWEPAVGGDGAVDRPAYGIAWLEGRFG